MPFRNNIFLRRLAQPRRVTIPSGRTVLARYEHLNRASLYRQMPENKRIYTQKIGPRRQKKQEKNSSSKREAGISIHKT